MMQARASIMTPGEPPWERAFSGVVFARPYRL
jgi:hypothetical protein